METETKKLVEMPKDAKIVDTQVVGDTYYIATEKAVYEMKIPIPECKHLRIGFWSDKCKDCGEFIPNPHDIGMW